MISPFVSIDNTTLFRFDDIIIDLNASNTNIVLKYYECDMKCIIPIVEYSDDKTYTIQIIESSDNGCSNNQGSAVFVTCILK